MHFMVLERGYVPAGGLVTGLLNGLGKELLLTNDPERGL